MQKTKVYNSQEELDKFIEILNKLYPEYVDIQRNRETYKFSKYEPGTFSRFFANLAGETTSLSLLELMIFHIPKRLSYYKCGNLSFATYYLMNVINVIHLEPKFLMSYVVKEFNKIKSPFSSLTEMDFFKTLEDVNYNEEDLKKVLVLTFDDSSSKNPDLKGILNSMRLT